MISRTERLDAIEEHTQRLHDKADEQLREELQAKYLADFGPLFVRDNPFKITDGPAFERLVIERMRKNAQQPTTKKEGNNE